MSLIVQTELECDTDNGDWWLDPFSEDNTGRRTYERTDWLTQLAIYFTKI